MPNLSTNTIKSFWQNKANSFVIKIVGVYAIWKLFHYWVNKPNTLLHNAWADLIQAMGTGYAAITSQALNIFGAETFGQGIAVVYQHSQSSIRIEDHCLAIPAMVVFTFTILLFGGQWKNKLWFIPLGLFGIFIINLIRLMFVCYAFEHFSQRFYDINHSIVYVVATYSLILAMIMWWMKRFDGK